MPVRNVRVTLDTGNAGYLFRLLFPFVHPHPVMHTFPIGIARFNGSCNASRYTVDPGREGSLFLQLKKGLE